MISYRGYELAPGKLITLRRPAAVDGITSYRSRKFYPLSRGTEEFKISVAKARGTVRIIVDDRPKVWLG